MAIGTAAAILGAASIGGSLLGASKASSAQKHAADLQAQASREANELNRYIYDTTRQDNETRRTVGDSSLLMLSDIMGVPRTSSGGGAAMIGGGAPGTTAPRAIRAGDAGMGQSRSMAGGGQVIDMYPQADGSYAATSQTRNGIGGLVDSVNRQSIAQGAPGGLDYAAISQTRPDLKAEYDSLMSRADRNSPWFAQHGLDRGFQGFVDYWAQHAGAGEAGTLPRVNTAPTAQTPSSGGAPAAPWVDPTSPGGYMVGARPDLGPGPAAYVAPQGPSAYVASARTTMTGPNLSYDAYQDSPEFKFRMDESRKELDRLSSAGRGVYSGRRMIAGIDRAQGVASEGYRDYRNFSQGQYNLERARQDQIDESDRAFGYGQSRDARGDFVTDRGFGYGQARDARGDFMVDRSRSDGLYADDRANTQARYDQRNNTLLNLAGFGPAAASSNASAAQTFAQSTNASNQAAANARGDAAIGSANAWNSALGGLMTTGAYLYGQGGFGGGAGAKLPKTYSI